MALTGLWKESRSIQSGARKWGTGVNPIHSVRQGDGRHIAPEGSEPVDTLLTRDYDNDGWSNEPWQEEYHELPRDIGMYDRPNYQDNPQHFRADVGDYPQWGPYEEGIPGGTDIRTHKHGADDAQTPNQIPTETVSEGWINKPKGDVENAVVSDPSQLVMNTSMTQRDKVREGSQRGEGSASEYSAPVRSRIPGQRLKIFSGGRRHADMQPKTQTVVAKPFWNRTAGTGNPAMLEPNQQTQRTPRTRNVPADPYTGPPVSDQANYGYQEEDVIPYA